MAIVDDFAAIRAALPGSEPPIAFDLRVTHAVNRLLELADWLEKVERQPSPLPAAVDALLRLAADLSPAQSSSDGEVLDLILRATKAWAAVAEQEAPAN